MGSIGNLLRQAAHNPSAPRRWRFCYLGGATFTAPGLGLVVLRCWVLLVLGAAGAAGPGAAADGNGTPLRRLLLVWVRIRCPQLIGDDIEGSVVGASLRPANPPARASLLIVVLLVVVLAVVYCWQYYYCFWPVRPLA